MILVNITTTSTRLDLCSATLWSLINQKIEEDYIINLWISKDAYLSDHGIDFCPEFIEPLNDIKNIIRVRYTKNIGPYRKLIPCIREAMDDDIIVYADDDVIYSENWLNYLITDFEGNNRQVAIASRVRVFKKNIFGIQKGYFYSKIVYENNILIKDFMITGVGGVVVSRKLIREELLMNDDFISIASMTDDVWFTKLLNISCVPVKVCIDALNSFYELSHDKYSLCSQNTTRNGFSGIFSKVDNLWGKIISYIGLCANNNDVAKKNVDIYFKNKK